jgi:hypothetical protein
MDVRARCPGTESVRARSHPPRLGQTKCRTAIRPGPQTLDPDPVADAYARWLRCRLRGQETPKTTSPDDLVWQEHELAARRARCKRDDMAGT